MFARETTGIDPFAPDGDPALDVAVIGEKREKYENFVEFEQRHRRDWVGQLAPQKVFAHQLKYLAQLIDELSSRGGADPGCDSDDAAAPEQTDEILMDEDGHEMVMSEAYGTPVKKLLATQRMRGAKAAMATALPSQPSTWLPCARAECPFLCTDNRSQGHCCHKCQNHSGGPIDARPWLHGNHCRRITLTERDQRLVVIASCSQHFGDGGISMESVRHAQHPSMMKRSSSKVKT